MSDMPSQTELEEMEQAAADQIDAENEGLETAVSTDDTSDTSPLTMVREPSPPDTDEREHETRILIGRQAKAAPLAIPRLQATQVSHVGAIRERNEDACLALNAQLAGHFQQLPFGLYIVADGMGGHMNGHEASNLAIRVASRHIINRLYLPMLQATDSPLQIPVQEVLTQAVAKANAAIFSPDPELDGGTTLTIALIIGQRLYVAHVGDSRAYLLRQGQLEQITDDHSLVRRLQDVGQLAHDDEILYSMRHVLLRAVGQGDELEVDSYTLRLPSHGRLLLCSDGLSGIVSDPEIEALLQQPTSLSETADALFQAAMAGGGHDNISLVIVDFDF